MKFSKELRPRRLSDPEAQQMEKVYVPFEVVKIQHRFRIAASIDTADFISEVPRPNIPQDYIYPIPLIHQ